jgi:methionyl-tRNA formyltransferase
MPSHIVFLGTPDFALVSLRALLADPRLSVDLVVTQPSKPVGRYKKMTDPPVKTEALARGIAVQQPDDINQSIEEVKSAVAERPDFLVTVAYGQLLSDELLAWPRVAPVNLHASLLPKLRGASPMQHAILNGCAETGVTIQRMVRALDAGPVLRSARYTIGPHETFVTLHETLANLGARLLVETLTTPLHETPQNANDATFCKKLTRADGNIDPTVMTAQEIDRRVRALTPWPGVRIGNLKILATSLEPQQNTWGIQCHDGTTLFVTLLQPDGKKPMTGDAYIRRKK